MKILLLNRGTETNSFIGWDESEDMFIVGTTTNTSLDSGNLEIDIGNIQSKGIYSKSNDLLLVSNSTSETAIKLNSSNGGIELDGNSEKEININGGKISLKSNQNIAASSRMIVPKTHFRCLCNYMTLQLCECLPDKTSVIVIFKIAKNHICQLTK